MQNIFSLELERHLLSGILRHPESFADIEHLVNESDFRSNLHQTIFGVVRQTLQSQGKLDKVLIAERIERLSLSFEDKISSVLDYLNSMTMLPVNVNSVKETAQELKLVSLRRELANTGEDITNAMLKYPNESAENLIKIADNIYNEKITLWNVGQDEPSNLFEGVSDKLNELVKNPLSNMGMGGPHKRLNDLYGSLLRKGNITTICSRSGGGKTTFMTDFCFKVSQQYDVPVLHLDNGEMLKDELLMRMVASLSGVPLYYIETGKFAKNPEAVKKVKAALDLVKSKKMFYKSVAGKSIEEMISIVRRFYMSRVGRGNDMVLDFDYVKNSGSQNSGNSPEWEIIGKMITKFKDFICDEIRMPMLTAVQSNRTGIVTGKDSKFVVDDESVFAGGDRTVFFSSHAFILRRKTTDEVQDENGKFGTHKLIAVKYRHLGEEAKRALQQVETPNGGKRSNYINLDFRNFHVREIGDAVDQYQRMDKLNISRPENTSNIL